MSTLQVEWKPEFDIATHWRLEARPEELTGIVLDPELLHLWSPSVFMDSEVVDRGRADGLGMTLRVYTKGFLPHDFLFIAKIVDLVPHRFMAIAVQGDFEGLGHLSVNPSGGENCEACFHWRIDVRHPWVKYLTRPLRSVLIWNHKWTMRRLRRLMQEEIYRRRESLNRFTAERPTFPHNVKVFQKLLRRRRAPSSWDQRRSLENL